MARRLIYRGRFFLHRFQLSGYKRHEFWHWMKDNWTEYVITYEHGLLNLLILVLFIFFRNELTESIVTVIIFIFVLFWMGPVRAYRSREKKPLVFTPRMTRLSIAFAILSVLLPVWGSNITYQFGGIYFDIYLLAFTWIIGDILLPFWLIAAATLLQPLETHFQEGFKKLARKKIASMPDLTVIGITGSYGKTSTKFMIRDLLKERYNVCTTPGSYNTPMGICKVINNDLQANHQVLILEMGARYEGNIKELCDIAQPDISVVTNVGIAHLETFGSQKAIQKTKAAIIENLVPNGTAVINADDPLVREMVDLRDDITVIETGLENGDIKASEISYSVDGCSFRLSIEGREDEIVQLPLLGKHNVQNLLLAIGVGKKLGIRLKTMILAAQKITPVEHRLELKKQNSITVIDDAFNSNPVGAQNAVDILSQFNGGRRIIVTPGMVELGEKEYEENKHFGQVIGQSNLDMILLVGPEQTRPIQDGLEESGVDGQKVKVFTSLFEANSFLEEYLKQGDIVLYENDLPDTYNEA
ncbi:MAG TPA: UDP-N-acetylmuramoyl-tripeptide--D-alanyl-D-alanine ligase [Balneolales bacterium]|nr:UDP-N-acetylmuramoyl-tripeptide--D-alanyl-D-alanine ligase [Balneolales bacterium]